MKNHALQSNNLRLLVVFILFLISAFLSFGCGDGGGGTTTEKNSPTVPADLSATTASTSQIDLSWTASTDDTGVTGYRIFQNGTAIDTATSTSYSDTGLNDNTQYCYNVLAFDAAGNESAQSSPVQCATTLKITAKLVASDASAGDQFGFSVAMSGDYAIVGAQEGDTNPVDTGAAYIYERIGPDTWDNEFKIVSGDADTFDRFGWSVAINGDLAIVGARFDDEGGDQAGAAYIFQWTGPGNTWDTGTKIMAQDSDIDDDFGISVAISSDFAVIGATGDDEANTDSGAIYIYNVQTTILTKIPSPDAGVTDLFGASVAISGDYIIVGATSTETAYIYHWSGSTWDLKRITAPAGTQGDLFGISVAIDGEYALVGAWGTSQSDGAAYIFQRTGPNWDSGAKIIANGVATTANFGKSVSIKGEYAIVGADNYDAGEGFTKIGTVYAFQRTGPGNAWDTGTQIFAVDTDFDYEKDAHYGNAVSISNDRAIVGSFLKNEGGSNEGAAYIFNIPPN